MSTLEAPRRVGRPRDERVEQAILEATIALLPELGFGDLTIDAVAAKAGVGKATIYRRWNSKADLVVAAVNCLKGHVATPDTGSVENDLVALWTAMAANAQRSDAGRTMPAIVAEADRHPDLRAALNRHSDERRAVVRGVLERGQARGELRDDIDLELVIDAFSSPIFYRRLLRGEKVRPSDAEPFVQLLMNGIATCEKPQRRGARRE